MSCVSAVSVAELRGVQEPRWCLVPAAEDRADADDAAELASAYGLPPDPWQSLVLNGWLGRRADGKWASPRCGLSVSRQNGKNALIEMRELFGMVMLGETIVHSAHEVKTARKAFKRLQHFFGEKADDPRALFPELNALVTSVRNANGQEAIYLENGGSVEFVARSKGSGRGFTVDVIVMDEAQELSDDALAALLPTRSAAPLQNPQLIYTGTPPSLSMNGEVFTRIRAVAQKGEDRRLCWHEWSCEPGVDIEDPASVAQSNPGLGIRLGLEGFDDDRADMDEDKFARERLGVWIDADSGTSLVAGWVATEDATSHADEVTAFGVEVSLDRAWTSIGVAGPNGDRVHLELVERRPGTGWVLERCKQLETDHGHAVFVLDGGGPAANLIPDFEDAGIWLAVADTKAVTTAAADIADAVTQRTVSHGPQKELELAVAGAKRRPLGDGVWAFGRKASNVDITPLVAVTLALWGHNTYAGGLGPDDIYIGSI